MKNLRVKKSFRLVLWLAAPVFSALVVFPCHARAAKIRAVFPAMDAQYLPAILAQTKGFFRDEGLDVELIVMRGGILGVQALIGGNVDFVMQFGSVFPAIWNGADLKIVAQMTNALFFSLIVRPEIQRIEELRGKRIGVTVGAITLAGVREVLKLNGIDPDRGVEYVNIPGSAAKIAALEKGLIAATAIAPPGELKSIRNGYKRLAFFGNVLPEMPFTGLVATNRYIKENPKLVDAMVRSMVRATALAGNDMEAAIGALQTRMKMGPDDARETYRLIQRSFNSNLTEAGVRTTAELVANSLGTRPNKEPGDYVDLSFLRRVISAPAKRG